MEEPATTVLCETSLRFVLSKQLKHAIFTTINFWGINYNFSLRCVRVQPRSSLTRFPECNTFHLHLVKDNRKKTHSHTQVKYKQTNLQTSSTDT